MKSLLEFTPFDENDLMGNPSNELKDKESEHSDSGLPPSRKLFSLLDAVANEEEFLDVFKGKSQIRKSSNLGIHTEVILSK